MIEGARLLPWLHEAVRRDRASVAVFLDCEKCMQTQSTQTRELMGCGYLPSAGKPSGRPPGYEGELTVCQGYSTKLPEVIEASYARSWWEKGQLREWAEGEPTAAIRVAIDHLNSQVHAAAAHSMEEDRKKQERAAAHRDHFEGRR